MIRSTLRLVAVLAVGALLSACSPLTQAGSGTSSEGWRQIATGVGQVVGSTKADAKIAEASEKLAQYCGALQAVATGATIFSPEKYHQAAAVAQAAVARYCANPPKNVAQVLTAAADTYADAVALRNGV